MRQLAKDAPTIGATTLYDGSILLQEETYGILDSSQDLTRVNKDDHSGIHEQLGITPVVALLSPLCRVK